VPFPDYDLYRQAIRYLACQAMTDLN